MSRSHFAVLTSLVVMFSLCAWAQSASPPGLSKPMDLPSTPGAKANSVPDYTSGAKRVEEEGRVQFNSDNIPVRFPVVVTDRSGKPVSNLKQDSFHVLEDGTEQKLTIFEEVTTTSDTLPKSQSTGPFTNFPLVNLQPRNVTVILVDALNSPSLDQLDARKQLISYLAGKSSFDHPTSLILLTSKGSVPLCSLTAEPKEVARSLASSGAGSKPESASAADPAACDSAALQQFVATGDPAASQLRPDRAVELTTQAFLETAWRVSGVPGKKSVVWITEGFPFALKTPTTLPGGAQSIVYERALAALHDADASLYPIDMRAANNLGPATKRRWLENSTPDMLKSFAAMTGGRAFLDAKEIPDALKNAASDATSYYLLGYDLNTKDKKPGWRQLTVKVANPDYQVLARSGFLVSNSVYDPELSRASELDIAAASYVGSTAIPLTAGFQGTSGKGGKRKAEFTLVIRGDSVAFGQRGNNHFQLDVLALAEKGDRQVAKVAQVVQGTLPPDQLALVKAHGVGYKNSLELPPGEYTVRFVVRDKLSGKVGTVSAPLTIQ